MRFAADYTVPFFFLLLTDVICCEQTFRARLARPLWPGRPLMGCDCGCFYVMVVVVVCFLLWKDTANYAICAREALWLGQSRVSVIVVG